MTQETKQQHPIARFKKELGQLKDAGELDMLPSTVSYDAFRSAAVVAVQDNPHILSCDRGSVFKAVRTLAAAGLVPDGREAAIVPFKGKAQAMPMVAGLIKVARNSGKIKSLWADVVYEDEGFRIWIEEGERQFEHEYDPLSRKGEIKGAYAVAKMTDGSVDMEPMSLDEIEKRRKASANQKDEKPTSIWAQWYSEMAKKTVIRALCKRLPMSTEDVERIMQEQESSLRDVTPEPEKPKETLAKRIMNETPPEDEKEPDEPAKTDDVEDAEIVDEQPIDEEEPAFGEGMGAAEDGEPVSSCPYMDDPHKMRHWMAGYKEIKGESK